MEKNTLLAIALSILVLLSWSVWVSKFYPIDNSKVTIRSPQPATPSSPVTVSQKEETEPTLPTFNFAQEKFGIVFLESQAAIKEVVFPDYQSYRFPLKYAFRLGDKTLVFRKESSSDKRIQFIHEDENKKIKKVFTFDNLNYSIELEIEIQNTSNLPLKINLPLTLGVLELNRDEARFQDVTLALKDKVLHLNVRKEEVVDQVKFIGLRDRYFCAIAQPETEDWQGYIKKIAPAESEIGLQIRKLILSPQQNITRKIRIYLGPQSLQLINAHNPEWSAVMYYGIFNFMARFLWQILEFLYRLLHNWGWAIIVLSVLIYLALFPLTLKQLRSMKAMQVLQPAIEELRIKYKDNPQKLNREILELYRQHKINPLGGCLPMILQLPIFLALYQVLMRSVALKGSSFLWIKDLSKPDCLFTLPQSLPIIGNEINILPLLMAFGMFLQQKISLKTSSGPAAEQQRLMTIILPVMFGVLFYRMPAGLVLYWFLNSSLMLIYQFRVNQQR